MAIEVADTTLLERQLDEFWTQSVLMPAQACPVCHALVSRAERSKQRHKDWHLRVGQ